MACFCAVGTTACGAEVRTSTSADTPVEPGEIRHCDPKAGHIRIESLLTGGPGSPSIQAAVRDRVVSLDETTLPEPPSEARMAAAATERASGYRMAHREAAEGRMAEAWVSYEGPHGVEAWFHVVPLPRGGWVVDEMEECPPRAPGATR